MTALPPFATVADLADRLGRDLTVAERRMADPLLNDAGAMILEQFAAPGESVARAVCCAMVLRVLRNPEGRQQLRIDDLSVTHSDDAASGLLRLLPHELDALARSSAVAGSAVGAFTITPTWSVPL